MRAGRGVVRGPHRGGGRSFRRMRARSCLCPCRREGRDRRPAGSDARFFPPWPPGPLPPSPPPPKTRHHVQQNHGEKLAGGKGAGFEPGPRGSKPGAGPGDRPGRRGRCGRRAGGRPSGQAPAWRGRPGIGRPARRQQGQGQGRHGAGRRPGRWWPAKQGRRHRDAAAVGGRSGRTGRHRCATRPNTHKRADSVRAARAWPGQAGAGLPWPHRTPGRRPGRSGEGEGHGWRRGATMTGATRGSHTSPIACQVKWSGWKGRGAAARDARQSNVCRWSFRARALVIVCPQPERVKNRRPRLPPTRRRAARRRVFLASSPPSPYDAPAYKSLHTRALQKNEN